jgi:hypothetical protein
MLATRVPGWEGTMQRPSMYKQSLIVPSRYQRLYAHNVSASKKELSSLRILVACITSPSTSDRKVVRSHPFKKITSFCVSDCVYAMVVLCSDPRRQVPIERALAPVLCIVGRKTRM